MAAITFEAGDKFTSKKGMGVVLNSGKALIISGDTRQGFKKEIVELPEDATPGGKSHWHEINLSLDIASLAIKEK